MAIIPQCFNLIIATVTTAPPNVQPLLLPARETI